jgi:surfeit locus 1 family protein
MRCKYNVDQPVKKSFPDWLPFVIGALLVVQFAGLGAWQVGRGLEKRAERELFEDDTAFVNFTPGMAVRPYQRIRATGRPDSGRQFLLDNIILESRIGHYVILALETAPDEPLLLVNRGWIERSAEGIDADDIALDAASITVHGRAGSLPRAGYRMGAAIVPGQDWPKHAVYPLLGEIEAELGRAADPVVLLLDPEDRYGFLRYWVPEEMGPGRHFAYALQWFAMGAVLSVLLVWNYRRQGRGRG